MNKKLILILLLAWPLLGIAGLLAVKNYALATAPSARYEITGYDPRDLMYGHYLRFRFVAPDAPGKGAYSYYIPEQSAPALQALLRDHTHKMTLDVQQPQGETHFGMLYIDDVPWQEFLRAHSNIGVQPNP